MDWRLFGVYTALVPTLTVMGWFVGNGWMSLWVSITFHLIYFATTDDKPCRPGGHYWDYQAGNISFIQIPTTHMMIGYHSFIMGTWGWQGTRTLAPTMADRQYALLHATKLRYFKTTDRPQWNQTYMWYFYFYFTVEWNSLHTPSWVRYHTHWNGNVAISTNFSSLTVPKLSLCQHFYFSYLRVSNSVLFSFCKVIRYSPFT